MTWEARDSEDGMEQRQLKRTQAQDTSSWPLPLPGHQYRATLSSGTEEPASGNNSTSHRTSELRRAWFVLRNTWPRSSIGDLLTFMLTDRKGSWRSCGKRQMLNVVFQEGLRLLPS